MPLRAYPASGITVSALAYAQRDAVQLATPPDVNKIVYVNSGSSAIFAILNSLSRSRSVPLGAGSRKILLPAYCCPRVLGAVLGAGWHPVLVDLEPGTVGMSLRELPLALSAAPSAVLSVDLFGLSGAQAGLRVLCQKAGVAYIRDLAQSSAIDIAGVPLCADFGVLSFGRGKPISVLAGGAILLTAGHEASLTASLGVARDPSKWLLAANAIAYNFATSPLPYALLRQIPHFHVGESRLVETDVAERLADSFGQLVAGQAKAASKSIARRREQIIQLTEMCRRVGLELVKPIGELPTDHAVNRVAVLAPTSRHAEQVAEVASHFGVTRMYERTLSEFQGMAAEEARDRWPNAFDFSRRLLTLPAHGRLPFRALHRLERLMASSLGTGAWR